MKKEVNQVYIVIKGKGPLYLGQHVVAFKDGSAHTVVDGLLSDHENFKIKPGPSLHLYEYIDNIQPIGLNETELINSLECPQCGNQSTLLHNLNSETHPQRSIECGNCPVRVSDQHRDINQLITIWNNIKR